MRPTLGALFADKAAIDAYLRDRLRTRPIPQLSCHICEQDRDHQCNMAASHTPCCRADEVICLLR